MKLVIVQTPSQVKTLTDVLGDGWRVEPCYGMVRDLPTDKLGIHVDDDFRPTFTLAPGKGNLVRRLMKAVRECEAVYVATPPNRDGEALAWHVLGLSPDTNDKPVYRIRLNALTPNAIRAAFAAPSPLDNRQIEAHTTQRIIERLVGWNISAAARKAIGFHSALTYGGVVGLRVCAARESEFAAFTPQAGWRASVALEHDGVRFTAPVLNAKGAPLTLRNQEQVAQLETLLKQAQFWVDESGHATQIRPAPDALTLRRLIETAERDLHLAPERVLSLVETLYETGWITHPDGTPAADASEAASVYIRREYGTDYVAPDEVIRTGIAPTDVKRLPDDLPGDGAALYGLIWRRFIAAQLPPAQERLTLARIFVGTSRTQRYPVELRATAKQVVFDGWLRVLPAPATHETTPPLTEGEMLAFQQVFTELVHSEAPVRLTKGSLVNALVNLGFAVQDAVTAAHGLLTAEYVVGDESLTLTERGRVLADYLADAYDTLSSPPLAAELTADIDRIASGEQERGPVLRSFWARFGSTLRSIPASHTIREHKPIVLRPVEEL